MPRKLVLVIAALLLAQNACANHSLTKPQVTRRYKTIYVEGPSVPVEVDTTSLWRRNWIDASVFSIPATPAESPARDVFALAAEGQAAFIEAVGAKTSDLSTLTRGVAASLRREPQPESYRDMGVVKRRVVFSIANRSMSPADRLASVRIILRPQSGVRLVGWDKLATAYESIDIGTMSFSQKNTVGGELGLALNGAAPKVTGSTEAGMEEQLALRERLVTLSGTLTPTEASLLQQSTAGRDLTGNVIVDLEMDLPTQPAKVLTFVTYPDAAAGKVVCAQAPLFRFQTVEVPQRADRQIHATMIVEYVVRRVTQGHATLYEGDDVVHQIHAADTIPDVLLIPERDLRVAAWELRAAGGDDALEIQHLMPPAPNPETLQFGSYESAVRLRDWIAVCGTAQIPDLDFLIAGTPLPKASKPNLTVAPFWLNGAPPPPITPAAPAPAPAP